jgi:hypothetical protein
VTAVLKKFLTKEKKTKWRRPLKRNGLLSYKCFLGEEAKDVRMVDNLQ